MKKSLMVFPLVCLLCFAFACQDKEALAELEAMKAKVEAEEQSKAGLERVAEGLQKAWDNQDMAALVQFYAEDATMIMPGEPEPIRGREAIQKNQEAFLRAMPDFSVEFTLILISGNYIFFEGVGGGTFTGPMASPEGDIPPTGKRAEVKVAFIARVNADGLIEEDRTYYDTTEFMRQLGLIE